MITEHNDSHGWLSKELPGVHPDHTSPDEIRIPALSTLAVIKK
jgi:hypothetical protein